MLLSGSDKNNNTQGACMMKISIPVAVFCVATLLLAGCGSDTTSDTTRTAAADESGSDSDTDAGSDGDADAGGDAGSGSPLDPTALCAIPVLGPAIVERAAWRTEYYFV